MSSTVAHGLWFSPRHKNHLARYHRRSSCPLSLTWHLTTWPLLQRHCLHVRKCLIQHDSNRDSLAGCTACSPCLQTCQDISQSTKGRMRQDLIGGGSVFGNCTYIPSKALANLVCAFRILVISICWNLHNRCVAEGFAVNFWLLVVVRENAANASYQNGWHYPPFSVCYIVIVRLSQRRITVRSMVF